jgi:hypothetical protein
MDELAARRSASRSRGGVARIVAVAAAVVVVAGLAIGVTVATLRSNDKSSSGARASSGATSPTSNREAAGSADATASVVDFGTVPDAAALRAGVERALSSTASATDSPSALSDNSDSAPAQEFKSAVPPAGRAPAACVAKQSTALGLDAALTSGEPVEVLVFTRGNQAFVVAVADPHASCRLVASQLLRTGN